jgi:hypothetical protein
VSEEAVRDWLLCLAVVALLWTVLQTLRPPYLVEGSVAGTIHLKTRPKPAPLL